MLNEARRYVDAIESIWGVKLKWHQRVILITTYIIEEVFHPRWWMFRR